MADRLSREEKRRIAGLARTLHERLDGPPNDRGGDPPIDPDDLLAEWKGHFPDEESFAERLDHEGLTEAAVRDQLTATRWPAGEPLPAWLDDLESLVEHVEGRQADDRDAVATPEETPFEELLAAVADYARTLVDGAVPPGARPALERWLVSLLSRVAVRALYVEFKSFVEYHDPELAATDPDEVDEPPTAYYERFVEAMFDGGFRNLALEYPVLARHLVRVTDQWAGAVTTVCRRLRADRAALGERFGVEGEVTGLEVLADDAHAGGQVPVRVTFESGSVVYKPRPVDAGVALYTVLDRLDDHLETPPFRSPTYLPRDEYGWMEPVEYRDAPDEAAVERYYRRAGVLLAVGYVLDLPDLQHENVVAAGEQPTVVDAETLLHPHVDPVASSYTTEVVATSTRSVLRTALLPWLAGDVGDEDSDLPKPFLAAGLGASSESAAVAEVSKPTVEAINTDVMSVEGRSPTIDRSTNTPSVEDVDHPPGEYVDTIVEAFRHAYGTVRDLHGAGRFRSEIVDPGLVAGVENRLVYRATSTYRSNLRLGVARDPLRDGARLSVEFERLAAPFFEGRIESDRYWGLYEAERRSLRRRDVPRFSARADGTTIYHDGSPTGFEADAAGYDRLDERLAWLDDADLRRQTWLVRRSLTDSVPERGAPAEPAATTDDRLRDEAIRYGDAVLDAAIETAAGRGWVSLVGEDLTQLCVSPAGNALYDGRAGIGLAAAALYDRTGHDRFRDVAVDALDAVAEDRGESPTPFGGFTGTGSIVYALAVAADLLDRPAYRERAAEHARAVTAEELAADEAFDLMDGTAGMLAALLAHYERHGGPEVLDRAVDCGERLLDGRVPVDGYRVWKTGEGEAVPGIAHGVSGIAYALARLARVAGDDRYASAAREALDYETTLYAPERSNYEIPTNSGTERYQDRWCRGRTGCALARLGVGSELGDDDLLAAADDLLSATLSADCHRYDHLCCGTLGRSATLLEAARRTGRDASDARTVAGRSLARRAATGALSMPGHGEAVTNPTLFNGASGVAYAMLRLREPDALPCVLLLE